MTALETTFPEDEYNANLKLTGGNHLAAALLVLADAILIGASLTADEDSDGAEVGLNDPAR